MKSFMAKILEVRRQRCRFFLLLIPHSIWIGIWDRAMIYCSKVLILLKSLLQYVVFNFCLILYNHYRKRFQKTEFRLSEGKVMAAANTSKEE